MNVPLRVTLNGKDASSIFRPNVKPTNLLADLKAVWQCGRQTKQTDIDTEWLTGEKCQGIIMSLFNYHHWRHLVPMSESCLQRIQGFQAMNAHLAMKATIW